MKITNVFIYDLATTETILFDRQEQSVAFPDLVLAVQTQSTNKPVSNMQLKKYYKKKSLVLIFWFFETRGGRGGRGDTHNHRFFLLVFFSLGHGDQCCVCVYVCGKKRCLGFKLGFNPSDASRAVMAGILSTAWVFFFIIFLIFRFQSRPTTLPNPQDTHQHTATPNKKPPKKKTGLRK